MREEEKYMIDKAKKQKLYKNESLCFVVHMNFSSSRIEYFFAFNFLYRGLVKAFKSDFVLCDMLDRLSHLIYYF
jgi:hypothetical protein